MGIPFLLRNLQKTDGRIPLLDQFRDKTKNDYKTAVRIARKGQFNSIGIDESVFLHGHTKSNESIDENAFHIVAAIEHYITSICTFFEYYCLVGNDDEEEEDEEEDEEVKEEKRQQRDIKIFLSVDGPPPVKKNRRERKKNNEDEDYLDAYSKLSLEEKIKLQASVSRKLQSKLSRKKEYNFKIESNHYQGGGRRRGEGGGEKEDVEEGNNNNNNYFQREEGEIELIKFAKRQKRQTTNVILSSDSDVTAMVILNKIENIVIVSPKGSSNCPFIWDLQSISDGLDLNYDNLFNYVVLHFFFFGSDYNYGLMNCPTESKKKIIHESSTADSLNMELINKIGKRCNRTKVISTADNICVSELEYFKYLLIVEAICSILYYASLGERKDLFLNDISPLIYLKCKDDDRFNIGTLVSLINFQ